MKKSFSLLLLCILLVSNALQLPGSAIRSPIVSGSLNNVVHRTSSQITAQVPASSAAVINTAAYNSISKLLSTCGIGALAGKLGILDQNALSVLSKLIFSIFQPCLLFVSVSNTVFKLTSNADPTAMIVLPLAAFAQIVLGFVVGKVLTALIYGFADVESARLLQICTTFANSGPLPLVFADGIFQYHPDKALLSKSISYISLYLLGWSPLFWIVGPAILSSKDATANSQSTFIERAKVTAKRVLSPPVLASLFGMLVGITPILQKLIIAQEGLLHPIYEAMKTLGAAYLPTVLLVLAGSLSAATTGSVDSSKSPDSEALVQRLKESRSFSLQVASIYLARFLLMPSLAFALLGAAKKYAPGATAYLAKDPMLLFILLLETCMPSAQNSTVILQLLGQKSAAGALAKVLMVTYVLGVPAMTYWLIKILQMTNLAG